MFTSATLALVALLGPGFMGRRMRRKIQIAIGGIVAVVRHAGIWTLLVGTLIGFPPVIAAPNMLAHAESQACGARLGVIRELVMAQSPVEEGSLFVDDVMNADSIFVTNSWIGVMPVASVNGRPLAARTSLQIE